MLAGFPVVQPLIFPQRRLQTVSVWELADVVCDACKARIPSGSDLDVMEPESHSLREIVDEFRTWLGASTPGLRVTVPAWFGWVLAALADALGHLGWRSPLRTTALRVLNEDVVGNPAKLQALRGRAVPSLPQTLVEMPSTVQDRWFARLYLAMPLMVGTLALFWIASGAIGAFRFDSALRVLPPALAESVFGRWAVAGGVLIDVALGAAIVYRPWAAAACWAMIATTLCYLIGATLFVPIVWVDPLGPLVKTIPAMLLAWTTTIVLEER